MSTPGARAIERWIGAVLMPEVRVAGTWPGVPETVPPREHLERYPPAGVVAFGRTPGGAVSPRELIERVRSACRAAGAAEPFVACDLEQGAGLHFAEATRLPPALALASAATARGGPGPPFEGAIAFAGALTGSEAMVCGVDLVLAPIADVNTRRDNPIISVRSFGDEPRAVAARATEFWRGLRSAGAAGCAKHFPGHGDTAQDSHLVLPRVDRSERELGAVGLVPFRALVEAGVEAVMVAHLDVPALTREPGLPCTLSKRAIDALRGELGFRGAVLSDAMSMGALDSQARRYVRALAAGCDGLLCPHDLAGAARELFDAAVTGELPLDRLEAAARSMERLRDELATRSRPCATGDGAWRCGGARATGAGELPFTLDAWARAQARVLALRALRMSKPALPWERGEAFAVLDAFPGVEGAEARAELARLRELLGGLADHPRRRVLPVVFEQRAFAGRYGPSPDELAQLDRRVRAEVEAGCDLVLAWFGSPQTLPLRFWHGWPIPIVLAFAATPPLVDAVARVLSGERDCAGGSLPTRLG